MELHTLKTDDIRCFKYIVIMVITLYTVEFRTYKIIKYYVMILSFSEGGETNVISEKLLHFDFLIFGVVSG